MNATAEQCSEAGGPPARGRPGRAGGRAWVVLGSALMCVRVIPVRPPVSGLSDPEALWEAALSSHQIEGEFGWCFLSSPPGTSLPEATLLPVGQVAAPSASRITLTLF